ncbi:unnamed protein product [Rotaria sordida]|uniref:Ion transport domain-containing protein n=1 Tax=Rotaria sordida TaxID=392033 RepID=A0A814J5U9_9BILA|nr:unnamed protein product [Rotaria sordida]
MAQTKQLAAEALDEELNLSAVERQTEASHKGGTIWEAVRKADQAALERLLDTDHNSIYARGPVGDCPIHMLFLYGTGAHLNMARYLITRFPETVVQIYNQPEYYGEIALHIAIVNRNASIVKWLLSDEHIRPYREQQLAAAANGHFFQFGRPCYYGETPLAFACCTNQWNIAEILLKYGASMDMVDSNGNTILHLLVVHNLPQIYTKFKERWLEVHAIAISESSNVDDDKVASTKKKKVPLWKRLNKDGFTPFTLAAKLGLTDMFSFLLDERKIVQWRYGPVSCVLYPLDELELEFQQEGGNTPGALELIVQNAQVELIMHPRIIDLVDQKWERFARRIFFRRFLVTIVYLFIFLITTILNQTRIETTKGKGKKMVITSVQYPGGIHQIVRIIGRLIVLAGAVLKGKSEIREMTNVGIRKYFQATGAAFLENCLSCSFCCGIIIVNILYLLDIQAQTIVLALVSIISWGYMLFFVMAFQLTGPFVFMIYEMFCHDVLRFCIIYMVFLAGFSQAFFVLFDNNGFDGFLVSIKQCFFGILGDFDLNHYTGTTFQYTSVLLLVIYVVVVSILLLNLLIAMMGDTYGNVIEGATQIWHLERARIVFAIENEMSTDERKLDKNKYWTNVDGQRYLQIKIPNLKCFVLSCASQISCYDELILSFLDRISNLEKLGLYLTIYVTNRFIDGNHLKKNIFSRRLELNVFAFDIRSFIVIDDHMNLPSKEDIQRTFIDFQYTKILSYVDYFLEKQLRQCHIYSYLSEMRYYQKITNHFPDGLYQYARLA